MGKSGFGAAVMVVVAIIAIVASVITISSRPHSSSGVVTIDAYTARVPAGETLVLTSSGKSSRVWLITWDGEHEVYAEQKSGFFGPAKRTGTLCGTDCTIDVGTAWPSHIEVAQRSDHTIEVHWPFGWGYLRPESETK